MSSAAKVSIIIGVLSIFQLAPGQFVFGQGRRGGWGGRDENRPMSDDEIARRMARTKDFLKTIDTNGNGMIDPDEASDAQAKPMLDRIFSRLGKEPHYPMAISEILQGVDASYRARGNTGGGGTSTVGGSPSPNGPPSATPAAGGGSSNSSTSNLVTPGVSGSAAVNLTTAPPSGEAAPSQASASVPAGSVPAGSVPAGSVPAGSPPADAKPAPRKPGRFLTARERLPKGLPDWFLEKDVNGDGQVTMAQFTDNWTPEKVAEFARYDLNHDGIITAAECLKVEKAKAGGK